MGASQIWRDGSVNGVDLLKEEIQVRPPGSNWRTVLCGVDDFPIVAINQHPGQVPWLMGVGAFDPHRCGSREDPY